MLVGPHERVKPLGPPSNKGGFINTNRGTINTTGGPTYPPGGPMY